MYELTNELINELEDCQLLGYWYGARYPDVASIIDTGCTEYERKIYIDFRMIL